MTVEGDAAVAYQERLHWPVFPLHPIVGGRCGGCGGEQCAGKHPVTMGWQNTIVGTALSGAAWHERLGARGIGLVCGPRSGVFALDADRRHGADETLRAWGRQGRRSGTVVDATGDGWHFMYRWPEGFDVEIRAQDLGGGIQCRGAGHYLVLAPSMHRSGRRYRWLRSPEEHELAEAPDWLLEQIAQAACRRGGRTGPRESLKVIAAGRRHDALVSFCGLLRSCGLGEEAIVECGFALLRHHAAPDPPMDFRQAEHDMRDVARRYPPTAPQTA
jgi:hypothetical protein